MHARVAGPLVSPREEDTDAGWTGERDPSIYSGLLSMSITFPLYSSSISMT